MIQAISWVLAATLVAISPGVFAQSYPSKPVKLVVPYPAGGATDSLGRMYAQKLGEAWKQSVVVENRAGAGGNIGADAVAKATPDGHTVLFTIVALVQQIPLKVSLSSNLLRRSSHIPSTM